MRIKGRHTSSQLLISFSLCLLATLCCNIINPKRQVFEITSIVSIQLPGRAITIFEMVAQSFIKTDPDLPGILSGHLPCSPLRETVCPVMWFERCTANVVWTLHGTCCTAAHAEDSLQISHSKVFYLGIWPRFALRETLPLGQLSLLHIPPTLLNTYVPTYTV